MPGKLKVAVLEIPLLRGVTKRFCLKRSLTLRAHKELYMAERLATF